MQWDLHKSEYSVAYCGVGLRPTAPREELFGNIVKQVALHPEVIYRLEAPNGESGLKAILVNRSTGKTIAQLPVGNQLYTRMIRRADTWAEWDPSVHSIVVQYHGKDIAPFAEQAEPSANPLLFTLQEHR